MVAHRFLLCLWQPLVNLDLGESSIITDFASTWLLHRVVRMPGLRVQHTHMGTLS